MIVTVTLNPAVDKTLVVRGFTVGTTNRAAVERVEIGGKGINVAQNLARLGCDVVATGFLGREDMHGVVPTLAAQGVHTDFVRIAGDTRVNLKVLDPATGAETEINETGSIIPGEAIDELTARLRALARRCDVMVFSGSLPPGAPEDLYAHYIALAAAAGVRTVLDSAGAALQHGLAAAPDVVKPNRAEAEQLLQIPIRNDGDLIAAAGRLLELGARTAVISLGAAGALSASAAGMWRARLPEAAAQNTVGAGDAMVAALAHALTQRLLAPEALRLATALASAAAASAAPIASAERVDALLPRVRIEAVAPAGAPNGLRRIGR